MSTSSLIFIICGCLFLGLASVDSAASNSLADCQATASAFRTTISTTVPNITATTGVNVTCASTNVSCPGQVIGGVCIWQRKLSAVCRSASGVIKIRIQTNNLPPRCTAAPQGSISELNIDFEVNYNPDVNVNVLNQNLNSVSALSQKLCLLTNPSSVPSASGFVNYGTTNLDTATGVSVDGIVIFSPDSLNNVDPFYPPPGSTAETVDTCLAHPQGTGIYHYHIAHSCMVNPPNTTLSACMNNVCSANISAFSINSFSNYQTQTVIGLSKDGHVIFGPYLSANNRVTSGFDACNGMFYDNIGNYAYFATSTYPYLVGCFGPANYPSFGPNCTSNGASSYSMSSFALSFVSNSSNFSTASTSSSGGSSLPPSTTMGSGSTSPPSNGSSLPPSTTMGSGSTSPPSNGSSLPPSTTMGSGSTSPPSNGSSLPPSTTMGSGSTSPPSNGSSLPPSTTMGSGSTSPPSTTAGTGTPPPSTTNGTGTPPPTTGLASTTQAPSRTTTTTSMSVRVILDITILIIGLIILAG